jgi:hypothetical protein
MTDTILAKLEALKDQTQEMSRQLRDLTNHLNTSSVPSAIWSIPSSHPKDARAAALRLQGWLLGVKGTSWTMEQDLMEESVGILVNYILGTPSEVR